MSKKYIWFVVSIVFIGLLISTKYSFATIVFKKDAYKDIVSMLSLLATFALFIERSIEVILSAFRGKEAELKDLQIREAEEEHKKIILEHETIKKINEISKYLKSKELQEELDKLAIANSFKDTKIKEINEYIKKLHEERTKYRIESGAMATWIGLGFVFIVAIIGVRSIEFFIDPKLNIFQGYQKTSFNLVDIALTGLVLAGGSEAINKLTKLYTKATQTATKKAEGTG